MINLKELRESGNLTQGDVSKLSSMPLRTYQRYETNPRYVGTLKYNYLCDILSQYLAVNENKGLLSIEKIQTSVADVLKNQQITFCYLFGSYAKNKATETSDVDLLIDGNLTGLPFYGLLEELQEKLHKKVDLLRLFDVSQNQELLAEIMRDGIKIYG